MSRRKKTTVAVPAPSAEPAVEPFTDAQMQVLQNVVSASIAEALGNGTVSTTPANQQLSQAAGATAQSATASSLLSSRGKAGGLFAHVQLPVIEKVRRGEYIDFSHLLPPIGGQHDSEPLAKRVRLSEDDGQLVLSTSSASKRKIENIHSWLEAWSIFCAIVVSNQPSKALGLISYQATILQASRRYRWSAVCDYDVSFRQRMARDLDMVWDTVDTDLYARSFTGQAHAICNSCKRPGHSASTCTARDSGNKKSSSKQPICAMYNSSKCSFPNCRFRHCCKTVWGDHPASRCGTTQ